MNFTFITQEKFKQKILTTWKELAHELKFPLKIDSYIIYLVHKFITSCHLAERQTE